MMKIDHETLAAIFERAVAAAAQPFPALDLGEINDDALTAGAELELEHLDLDTTSAKPGSPASIGSAKPGTTSITIRVPRHVLAAYKARAAACRQPYQRLMNRALQKEMWSWNSPAVTASTRR